MTGELITDSSGNDAYTNPLTFSQWGGSIGNNITDDKDKFIGYGNYLREFEFERGTLDADTEAAIGNIVNGQVTQIDPEYKPSLDSGTVDTDANLIFEAFGTQAKNDFLKGIEEGGKREDFSAEVNEAKQHLVEHGRLSLASLRTQEEDGSISYELIGDSNILDSRKAVAESLSRGAIRHRDMWQVAKGMEKGKSGVNTFKAIRDNQVRSEFSAASQAEDKELYNDVLKEAKEYFINNKEDSDPSTLITKARSLLAKGYSSDKGIEEKVSRSRFQDSDIMDALEQVALFESYQTGEAEFITDPNKLGDNIKVTKNGAVIPHINLLLDGDKFDSALELRKDLTRSQKRSLENYRKDFFTRQFPRYNEFFQDSTVENKWAKAKVEGKQNGLSNGEILESFMSDSRNYSGVKNRLGALGASIADSFTGLAFIIPALFENKGAIDFLVSQEEDRQKRREIAKVFGDNFGFGMDVSTAIAPMVVDIGATVLLSSFTYGAGGVAYIATKQGVNLTAKGAIKSLTGSVLTRQFGEDAATAATRLKMKGYIKNSKKSDVVDAINTFNGLLTNKKGGASALVKGVQTSSLFLTAANRSAGATFATVYGNLEGTHEEKYDAALGAAMTAGMATGLITAGFSAVGAGGFEDAFLKGISAKQHRSLLERMSRSKLTKTQYGEIMKEYLSERIKEVSSTGFKDVYRRFLKSGSEEFLEEGIDEFVNSFIVDAALNEDTPMIDRVTGAMYAGAVGGVIGQGAAGVRSIAEKKGAFERGGIEMLRQSEENKLIEKLRESSSPLTANALMESLTRLELRRPSSTKETVEELNTRIGKQREVTQQLEEERKKVEEAKQAAKDELGINIVMGTVSEDGRLAGVNPDTNQITIYKQHIKDDFNSEEILPYLTGSGGGATSAQKEIVFKDIDLVKFKQALGSVEQYQKFIEEHEKAHIRLGHKREGLETEQGIANEIAANEAAAEAIGLNWNSLKKVENEISSAPTPESRATQEQNIRNILNGALNPEQAAIKEQELRKQEVDEILDGDDIPMEGQEEVAKKPNIVDQQVKKQLEEIEAELLYLEEGDPSAMNKLGMKVTTRTSLQEQARIQFLMGEQEKEKQLLEASAQAQLDNDLDQNPNETTASQIRNLDPPTSFETLDKLRQDKVIKLQSLLNQLTMLGQTFGVDTKLVSDEQNIAANADGEPIKAFSYVLGETESYIQINPYEVYRLIDGLSDRNARSLTSSIVTEEIIHAATLADLSTEEITDYYNSLPASQIDSTIDSYYLTDSDRAAARARLTDADPEVVAKEQRTLAKESLRMHTQIGLRGFTSEQDRAFYLDNPNVVSVLLRYIKGFLNRIARALKNDKENPHLRVAVNRITQAYNDMRSGYMIGDVPLFDPDNPLKVVNTLRSEYEGDVNMPPEVGTVVEVTESQIVGDEEVETTKEVAFKHGDLTGMLTLPLMYTGDYKRKGKVMRWLTGQGDPRLRSLNQQATALRNTVFNEIQKYKTKLEFLIAEAYPEGDAPVELFKLITGDGETLKLDKETKDFIETEFTLRTKILTRQLNALDEELKTTADKDKELERESVAEQLLELPELREKAFNLAFENKKAVLNQKREDAINQLGGYDDKGFPNNEIVLHLLELRKKTDAFSKKIAELYPNDKDAARKLKGTIDANLEIYITRSYRLFSDAGYADKVMNESEYRTVREQAALIFMDEYVNLRSIQIVTNKEKDSDGNVITRIDDARDIAQKEIDYDEKTDDNISKTIHNMMVDYLNSFGSDVDPMVSPATLVSYDSAEKRLGFTSILKDRLKKRKEIPKQLRELMGEEGDNTGYDGIMRTYMHVGIMASHQAFIKNVIDFGMDKENNWIITGDQYDRIAGDSPDKNNYGVFKLDGSEFDLTKIRGKGRLYADKEMIATIKAMHDGLKTSLNETEVAAKQLNRAAQVLTGSSMAAKTLGSVGFYIRNAMSNVFYFGISQGMVNPIKMTPQYMKNFRNEIARKRGFFGKEGRGGEDLDAYYSKLDALDIIGDEIRPKFLDEIFRGEETPNSLMNKIYDVTKKIQNESDENTTEDTLKKTGSKLNKLYVSLQEMSAAMDTFYKITYFEHEVDVLRKARDAAKASTDPKENTGKYAKMTDYQIDRAAAEKVLSTAQSYSRSSPFVRGWTNSTLGVMFAPFIRFKAEVVRISVNTIRLSIEEIKDKESAVVRARGWKRLTGFLGTTVGLSAVAPLIARLITDVDDDEDAALRRTLVEYLQGHTFILYRDGEELKSLDFTYINPYALLADPVLRAVEKGFRGEGVGAMTMAFVDGLIFKEYLDDQIFAGALIGLKANRDPQTNKKIYEERDTAYDAFYKGTTFLLKEAFEPRTIKAGREVATMIGTNPVDQIFKRIGAEFLPFKPYKIDISNNLRRYLFDVRRETQNISMRKNKVLSDRPISDSDMKSLVLDEIKHRVRLDKEVLHTLEHMGSLGGLSDKEVRDIVFGAQFGKRRYGFMMQGKTETPKETHKGLKKKLRDKYQLTGDSEFLRRERLLDAYFKSLPRFYYHDVED